MAWRVRMAEIRSHPHALRQAVLSCAGQGLLSLWKHIGNIRTVCG
jgi:hypothetical protein